MGAPFGGLARNLARIPLLAPVPLAFRSLRVPADPIFPPKLSLNYDSGSSNGPFGLGWNLSVPSITRKTEKGLPGFADAEDSDLFILSDAEDLIPALVQNGSTWTQDVFKPSRNSQGYTVSTFGQGRGGFRKDREMDE